MLHNKPVCRHVLRPLRPVPMHLRFVRAAVLSPNSTCYVTSRHDTTRYQTHTFWVSTGKSRDVLCRACRTARRDTRVTTSATRTRHVFSGVGMVTFPLSTSLFPEVVPEIDANPEQKKTKLVHASTTATSSSATLEQARRACCVVTSRNKWNLGFTTRRQQIQGVDNCSGNRQSTSAGKKLRQKQSYIKYAYHTGRTARDMCLL